MTQAGNKISQTAQQMTHSAQETMGQAKDNVGQATQEVSGGKGTPSGRCGGWGAPVQLRKGAPPDMCSGLCTITARRRKWLADCHPAHAWSPPLSCTCACGPRCILLQCQPSWLPAVHLPEHLCSPAHAAAPLFPLRCPPPSTPGPAPRRGGRRPRQAPGPGDHLRWCFSRFTLLCAIHRHQYRLPA